MSRILIIDDEAENREALKRSIGDENPAWQITLAKDEIEGKAVIQAQLAKGEPIDVILTDLVMMNEQSGMNILQEARKIDPLVMAILFTAKEKSLDRYAAFDYGAFDVVEKNIRGTSAARELGIKTRAALRYREWSQRINFLRRYFDPKLFDMVEKQPELLAVKQRTVTVCFWDIRGFSTLCEVLKAHPTLIVGFLKEYCELAATIIFKHGGLLDKFIGDGVMALFGVLGSENDEGRSDATSALKAAIELRGAFDGITPKWMERWALYTPQKIEVGLGCGVHTGDVLVGNVGTDFRDQFTALGPHVNFAARIQGRAKGGEILLSQSTATRVKAAIPLVAAGEISDVKNIPGEFTLHAVEAQAK
jgi:class 3 adenylate cyclase